MRVAVVCPYDLGAFGGVQGQVIALVGWLREAGHEAWAVSPGTGGPPGTRHVGPVVSVPANRSRAPITFRPGAWKRVRAALEGAEVIHVHEPLVPVAGPAAILGAAAPRVGTFHADPGAVVSRLYRGAAPLLRRVIRRLAVATAVSPVAAAAVSRFAQARVIPNGLDTALYRPDDGKVPGRVVFVGRDEPRKGLDLLLQAWPLVRTAAPAAALRVVGAARPSGPEGVTFLGRVDEEAKRRELAEAEALCAPNLGGESFGLIVAEGMAAGCAVVASDLPAFRQVAGACAWLTPVGDAAALAEALVAAVSDRAEAGRRVQAGLREVERFDRAAVLEAYLAAYRDALAAG